MVKYELSNFEQIATAIGVKVGQIAKHQNLFEEAARWYRLDKRRPRRTAPSSLRRKVDQVAKDARRLLKSLGVSSPDEAADGPGDPEIRNALVLLGEPNEDPVIEGTRRIGRFIEIIEGVAAAAEPGGIPRRLAQRAKRDRPWRTRGSATACDSWAQSSSSSTRAVLSIGNRPEASKAAARSLRRLAHRLRETLAWAGTMRSRVWRISARSSGISAGRRPVSLAKVATADRRSRLRVSGSCCRRPGR
jgi:hypothetical protein